MTVFQAFFLDTWELNEIGKFSVFKELMTHDKQKRSSGDIFYKVE